MLDAHELAINEVRSMGEIERAHSIGEHLHEREDRGWERIAADERAERERRQQGAAVRAWVAQFTEGDW